MGNGQDVLMPWLNEWLLRRDKPQDRANALIEVNKRMHPVPSGDKEMQVSQNLFLLEAGCDAALDGNLSPQLEGDLIVRLTRERDELGLWGSECTSPIYHHFIITGLSAIYHNTNNATLKDLIEQNLGSFFWYAIRMGLDKSKHGLIGMRGTGHDFATSGFPALHFVCQYFTSGRPKNYETLGGWKDWLKDTGWVVAGLPGGRSYDLYKKVFEYAVDDNREPWKLRSRLTFLRVNGMPMGHFYQNGINGNTPCLIAYAGKAPANMSILSKYGYLPRNSNVRMRQNHDNSSCQLSVFVDPIYTSLTNVALTYSGAYNGLTGANQDPIGWALASSQIEHVYALTSDLSGVNGWDQIYPSKSIPLPTEPVNNPNPVTRPRKKKSPWWMFWK